MEVDSWVLSENQEEVEFRGLRIARVVLVTLCDRFILGSSQLGLKCLRLDRIQTIRKGDAIGAVGEFRFRIHKKNPSCALGSGKSGFLKYSCWLFFCYVDSLVLWDSSER